MCNWLKCLFPLLRQKYTTYKMYVINGQGEQVDIITNTIQIIITNTITIIIKDVINDQQVDRNMTNITITLTLTTIIITITIIIIIITTITRCTTHSPSPPPVSAIIDQTLRSAIPSSPRRQFIFHRLVMEMVMVMVMVMVVVMVMTTSMMKMMMMFSLHTMMFPLHLQCPKAEKLSLPRGSNLQPDSFAHSFSSTTSSSSFSSTTSSSSFSSSTNQPSASTGW